jgi:putative oxidoreductase
MTLPSNSSLSALSPAPDRQRWRRHLNDIADRLGALPMDRVLAPAARLAMAAVFWLSGRTKVDGWISVSDNAVTLFAEEYKLPFVAPELAAHAAAYAEHLLPVLLVLGLFTRFSALALLGMTAVIQVLVYPQAWPTHLTWAVPLMYLAWRGAGPVSLDRALGVH